MDGTNRTAYMGKRARAKQRRWAKAQTLHTTVGGRDFEASLWLDQYGRLPRPENLWRPHGTR